MEDVTVSGPGGEKLMTPRHALLFALFVAAGILAALLGRQTIGKVSDLYPLAFAAHPYFVWSHAGLLYLLLPFVVAGSFILLIAPGAISILLWRQPRNFSEWLILGFGVSLLWMIGLEVATKLIFNGTSAPVIFITIWIVAVVCLLVVLIARVHGGADLRWPMEGRSDRRRLIWIALLGERTN